MGGHFIIILHTFHMLYDEYAIYTNINTSAWLSVHDTITSLKELMGKGKIIR